jgi:hypothetical protein
VVLLGSLSTLAAADAALAPVCLVLRAIKSPPPVFALAHRREQTEDCKMIHSALSGVQRPPRQRGASSLRRRIATQ